LVSNCCYHEKNLDQKKFSARAEYKLSFRKPKKTLFS